MVYGFISIVDGVYNKNINQLFFFRSDMQFMSNYTSAAAFRQPNGETRLKEEKLKRTGESVAAG